MHMLSWLDYYYFCLLTNKYFHFICASCVLIGVPSYRRLLLFAFEPSEACSRYIISGLCVLALPPFHAFSHLTSQMFNVASSLCLLLFAIEPCCESFDIDVVSILNNAQKPCMKGAYTAGHGMSVTFDLTVGTTVR